MLITQVDSAVCRMWSMHDRLGEELTEAACLELVESARAHGIKQPVLGRRISEDGFQFELIYGARRLFAAQMLRLPIPVQVCTLDDRSALIEMDIENRARRDITPYERGLSYKRWINAGFFASQTELARSLGVSDAHVSRVLKFAELPAAVVAAFGCGDRIREEWAVELARLCQDPGSRAKVIRCARKRAQCNKPASPQTVYAALVGAGAGKALPVEVRDDVVKDRNDRPLIRIRYRSKAIQLIIPRERITEDTLKDIVRQAERILNAAANAERRTCRVHLSTIPSVSARPEPLRE